MKAYKFRTAQNFDFVADIIINKRLYCSGAPALNDLREGDIRVGDDRGRDHLLWAYYAGGFTGMAIEVELSPTEVTDVRYADEFIFLSNYLTYNDVEGQRAPPFQGSTPSGVTNKRCVLLVKIRSTCCRSPSAGSLLGLA